MSPRDRPADGQHAVQDGEWVGSIAHAYGLIDWRRVWDHPANRALREKRGNPHVLAANDALFVPLPDTRGTAVVTGQRHTFRLRVPTQVLRIHLRDALGQPLAEEPYELEVECDGPGEFAQAHPCSDANGLVAEEVPMTAVRGTLKLTNRDETLTLRIGDLTPIDLEDEALKIRGVQERLAALGFYKGEVDGQDGPLTRAAVKVFQRFCRARSGHPRVVDPGPVDGIVGPRTRAALLTYFGS